MLDFATIGLTNRDKRVYEALLEKPHSSIRLVSEHTGINRGSVYESLKDLLAAGLVTYIEAGERRKYIAQDPEVLHELINERRRVLQRQHAGVDAYIEEFASRLGVQADTTRFAAFYEGDEGLAAILRDVLSTCRRRKVAVYHAISSPRVKEYLYHNFPHFTRERIKQGLTVKVIGYGQSEASERELYERRALRSDTYDTSCYTIIYDTKVAYMSIDALNIAKGVVIENKEVADIQRLLFAGLWERLGRG